MNANPRLRTGTLLAAIVCTVAMSPEVPVQGAKQASSANTAPVSAMNPSHLPLKLELAEPVKVQLVPQPKAGGSLMQNSAFA